MAEWDDILEAQAGDENAFTRLMTAQEAFIWRVCYACLRNREEAEDALIDVMQRVWQRIGIYRGECAFSSWVGRVARNVCIDRIRARQAEKRPQHVIPLDAPDPDTGLAIDPPDPSDGPEQQLEQKEALAEVHSAILQLPEEQRDVVLCYIALLSEGEERSVYQRMADRLDLPLGTVQSRLNRARRKLAAWRNNSAQNASDGVKGGRRDDM